MKTVTIIDMEDSDMFDKVLEDVINNKMEYTIYEDEELTKPLAVMLPYEEEATNKNI
jgi:hypothetical protein